MVGDKLFLGIGKNIHNSNATLLNVTEEGGYHWRTYINERLDRQKWSGHWPLQSLSALLPHGVKDVSSISENRDIRLPSFQEDLLNKNAPFYEMLTLKGLGKCTSYGNSEIVTMAHHPAHAYALLATLPYEKCYLLIMDGGGSRAIDYDHDKSHEPISYQKQNEIEHTSFYFWDGEKLHLLHQRWLDYRPSSHASLKFSEGIGSAYEKSAQLIFNDALCSGKVMGLAGYGQPRSIAHIQEDGAREIDNYQWQESWLWDRQFTGDSKKLWQEDSAQEVWKNLAYEVQSHFEKDLFSYLAEQLEIWGSQYGEYPLAMGGGCALNCTANFKLFKKALFSQIYVSPFPGDESISLGTSFGDAFLKKTIKWKPRSWEAQRSNFSPPIGSLGNVVEELEKKYEVRGYQHVDILCGEVAQILKEGHVVAWFQGSSECGPRALGHRSLLARADKPGIKKYLNDKIKFRENFRPYGASVIWDDVQEYFDVPKGFQNPFMSFTTPIHSHYQDLLKEIMHIDGTCRMQTVMRKQNPRYYRLLEKCRKKIGLSILLNTSLNTMGEPIVEGYEDALRFFEKNEVKYLVIEDYIIRK